MKIDVENIIILLRYIMNIKNNKVISIIDDIILNNYDLSTSKKYLEILSKNGIYYNENAIDKFRSNADEIQAQILKYGISMLPYVDYFGNLKTMKTDVPSALFYIGNINALNMNSVAVIGTRNPSIEGVNAGKFIGRELSKKNYNIVSGLAVGCDTCGHAGCIENGGVTTAVLAHSLEQGIYPYQNRPLAKKILDNNGLLVSEYCYNVHVEPKYLFERDRIQAGLSSSIIVVQCGLKSGTLHTVGFGIKNERSIYCIKYKSDEVMKYENCLGNSELYNKGLAKLITSDDLNKQFK